MQRKLPGIDIPAATEAKILHAAAFLAFKQHVERLARAGSDLQTYTCWMHGVEVCHSPYVLATRTDSDLPPPAEDALLRGQLPALRSPLWRVQVPLARFVEQPRRCAAPRCALPTKLGTTTIGTRSAWTFCWWRPTPPSLRRPTWSPKSSTRFNSDAQRVTLGSWVWERYSTNGAHGRAAWAAEGSCQFLSSRAFTQALSGGDPGQPGEKKELEHIGRFAAGWRAIVQALQLGTACIDCGDPTRRVGMCSACFAWRQPCGECGVRRKTLSES